MSNHVKTHVDDQEKVVILSRKEVKDIISRLATYYEMIAKGYKVTINKQKRDLLAVECCEVKKIIEMLKKEC